MCRKMEQEKGDEPGFPQVTTWGNLACPWYPAIGVSKNQENGLFYFIFLLFYFTGNYEVHAMIHRTRKGGGKLPFK